jgi:hypothetical protein
MTVDETTNVSNPLALGDDSSLGQEPASELRSCFWFHVSLSRVVGTDSNGSQSAKAASKKWQPGT